MSVWGRIVVRLPNLQDADLNRWRRDLLNTFDPDDFSIAGPLVEVPFHDLDLVPSHLGGVLFELNLTLTYYDVGSEYADPGPFVAYADWLEAHLPECRVFYGHDNSDDGIEPFDQHRRMALMEHYARFGNEPHLQRWREWDDEVKARAAQSASAHESPGIASPGVPQFVHVAPIPSFLQSHPILVFPPAIMSEPPTIIMAETSAKDTDHASGPIASSSSSLSAS